MPLSVLNIHLAYAEVLHGVTIVGTCPPVSLEPVKNSDVTTFFGDALCVFANSRTRHGYIVIAESFLVNIETDVKPFHSKERIKLETCLCNYLTYSY